MTKEIHAKAIKLKKKFTQVLLISFAIKDLDRCSLSKQDIE